MSEKDILLKRTMDKLSLQRLGEITEFSRQASEVIAEMITFQEETDIQPVALVSDPAPHACGNSWDIPGYSTVVSAESSRDFGCNEKQEFQAEAMENAHDKAKEEALTAASSLVARFSCEEGCHLVVDTKNPTYTKLQSAEDGTIQGVGNCRWKWKARFRAAIPAKCVKAA